MLDVQRRQTLSKKLKILKIWNYKNLISFYHRTDLNVWVFDNDVSL